MLRRRSATASFGSSRRPAEETDWSCRWLVSLFFHPVFRDGGLTAAQWNADWEIQQILGELTAADGALPCTKRYSHEAAVSLLDPSFDKDYILKKRLPYEQLDQLTMEILLGAR